MDIQFYGANCLVLSGRQTRVVVDDNLKELGAKSITKKDDIALFTQQHGLPEQELKLLIDSPGEFEISDVSIVGLAARAHIDEEKQHAATATMYKIEMDGFRILVTGHIYPELSDDQLEDIGTIDIIMIPVGGGGYTLDATGALALIKKIEPKLVVLTHYADKDLRFPVPQATLEDALKNLAMEPKETITKLKVKPGDLTDVTQLVVLEKA